MPTTSSSASPSKTPASTAATSSKLPPTQHVPSTSQPAAPNPQPQPAPLATPPTPCNRWETLYVYAFLVKFLPPAVNDLYDAVGFEQAIVSTGFNQILFDILLKFVNELRPHPEEPTTPDNVNAVLKSVVSQYIAKNPLERTVWWIETSKTNAHPFTSEDVDFFSMSWQDKLVLLRQLIDWQLAYSNIKEIIDIAWEVKYQRKKKKTNKTLAAEFAPPDEDDPMSINNLRMVSIGQDSSRMRYWVVDDSPRVWSSPNPWRMNCPLTVVTTTRDEYEALVKKIRDTAPIIEGAKIKMTKPQLAHAELIPVLEARFEAIDAHSERLDALKAKRSAEKAEGGKSQVEKVGSKAKGATAKAKGRSKVREEDEGDEMDVTEENAESGPSTSRRKAKRRVSAPNKAAGKKRKRESSPGLPDAEEDVDMPEQPEGQNLAEPLEAATKGKAAAVSGRRKSARGSVKAKEHKAEEAMDEGGSPAHEQDEEFAATPKPKASTKGQSKATSKAPSATPPTENAVPSDEEDSYVPEEKPPTAKKRRSTRNSSARVQATELDDEEDESTAATAAASSISSRTKKTVPARAVGSRRSGRLSKAESAEMDEDPKTIQAPNDTENVSQDSQVNSPASDAKVDVKAPPRKKTRTTRQSKAQAEDKVESASTSTVADDDMRDKMDVDASVTASPTNSAARRLAPSESGETTPVNPSHSLMGPQSPTLTKNEWAKGSQPTSDIPAVPTVGTT